MSYFLFVRNKTRALIKNVQNMNQESVFYAGFPAIGSLSYLLYSSKFLAPSYFSKVCGDNSIRLSNTLLINSILGNVLYLMSRKHMKLMSTHEALSYSAFGAVMFNFSSVLFWMFSKAYVPENSFFLMNYGVLTGVLFLYAAKSYCDQVDSKTLQIDENSE